MTIHDRQPITYANALHPRHMTTKERLATVCEVLARGLVRLRQRERQASAREENFALHFVPDRSGHATRHGDDA